MNVSAVLFGVARYADSTLNSGQGHLQFASADVRSFEAYLRAAWSDADSLDIHIFTDDEATSDAFQSVLEALGGTSPDLLIIYLAGHGLEGADGARFAFNNAEIAKLSGLLSGKELDSAFRIASPQRSLLLLDCCHAAGIVSGTSWFNRLDGDRARLFLASARHGQVAWEDNALGHGLFSNAILQGLASSSPLASADGFVDVEALSAHTAREVAVRAFSRKRGAKQEPVRGGVAAEAIRLPTAAVNVLLDQFSTYDALILRLRRWVQRAAVIAALVVVATDLSLQHLSIDADGRVVAQSGLRVLDPLRRALPGGIVDTGYTWTEIAPRDTENATRYDALRQGRLLAVSLHGLEGWPRSLVPLLLPPARAKLEARVYGRMPPAGTYDSTYDGPPSVRYLGLESLLSEDKRDAMREAYPISNFDLDCRTDITNRLDLNVLNSSTDATLAEIDWMVAAASNRAEALDEVGRIVAYRLFHRFADQDDRRTYDARREFARFASLVRATTPSRETLMPLASGWCALAGHLALTIGGDANARVKLERRLLESFQRFDVAKHGDLLPREAEFGLGMLSLIASHVGLEPASVSIIGKRIMDDERGLDGTPDIVRWLSDIAPFVPFPEQVRVFLFDALETPHGEHDFKPVTAFAILGRNADLLDPSEVARLVAWQRDQAETFGMLDAYAEGVEGLAAYLSNSSANVHLRELLERVSAGGSLAPPDATWRGDMLIIPNTRAEWRAIIALTQRSQLSEADLEKLLAYAHALPLGSDRDSALGSVAIQLPAIAERRWDDVRSGFINASGRAFHRKLIAEATAAFICSDELDRRIDAVNALRELWENERNPVARSGLAETIEAVAWCSRLLPVVAAPHADDLL